MPAPFLSMIYNLLGKFTFATAFLGILAVDFRDQITLGTLITTAVVIIIAGFFTIRSKIAATWHDVADAKEAANKILQKELSDEQLARVIFEKEQQELRHNLKNEIAARDLQLKSLEAKTDLTTALNALRDIGLAQEKGNKETHALLAEIRDRLPQGDTT